MIKIELNGEFLELDPDVQYAFDQTHPAFQDDFTSGDHSFPIEIPAGGINARLLGIPGNINAFRKVYDFNVFIWIGESRWKPGRLKIDRPGSLKHGAYILTGVRSFDSLEKKLSELEYSGDIVLGTTSDDVIDYVKTNASKNYTQTDFQFPTIRNEKFYSDLNPDWEYFINRWDYTNTKYLKNIAGGLGDPINKDALVPLPYVGSLLKYIFKNEGYIFNGSDIIDLTEDVLWNNVPLDSRADSSSRVAIDSSGQDLTIFGSTPQVIAVNDLATPPNHDDIGGVDTSNHWWEIPAAGVYKINSSIHFRVDSITGIPRQIRFGIYKDSTPLKWIYAQSVAIHLDLLSQSSFPPYQVGDVQSVTDDLYIEFTSGDVGKKITTKFSQLNGGTGTDEMDIHMLPTTYMEIVDVNNSTINVYSKTLNLKNHVPDVTVKDFLSSVLTHYSAGFDWDYTNRICYMRRKTNLIGYAPDSTYTDITGDSDPDHDIEIRSDKIKQISFNWPSDDDLLSNNFQQHNSAWEKGIYNTKADFPAPDFENQTALDLSTAVRYIAKPDAFDVLQWVYHSDEYKPSVFNTDGTTELQDNMCPLMMRQFTSVITGDVTVPQIEQEAYSPSMGLEGDRTSSLRIVKYYGFGLPAASIPDSDFQNLAGGEWVPDDPLQVSQGVDGYDINGNINLTAPTSLFVGVTYRCKYTVKSTTTGSEISFNLQGGSWSSVITLPVGTGPFTGYVDVVAGSGTTDIQIHVTGIYTLMHLEVVPIDGVFPYPAASSQSMYYGGLFNGRRIMWNDITADQSLNTAGDRNLYEWLKNWIPWLNYSELVVKNINFDINRILHFFQNRYNIKFMLKLEGADVIIKKNAYTIDRSVRQTRSEIIIKPWQ